MRIFLFLTTLISCASLSADVISSSAGELTGEVKAIKRSTDGEQLLQFKSVNSNQLLGLKLSALKKVTFPSIEEQPKLFRNEVLLTNGDRLPVNILSMSLGSFSLEGFADKAFKIPSKNISSLIHKAESREQIKGSEVTLDKWKRLGPGQIRFYHDKQNNRVRSSGQGEIESSMVLPIRYRLNVQLTWNQFPESTFIVKMAHQDTSKEPDTYELASLKDRMILSRRIGETGETYPLIITNRPTATYEDRQASIELRIDHEKSLLEFLVDDVSQGVAFDPVASPQGTRTLSLKIHAEQGRPQTFSQFSVTTWKDSLENQAGVLDLKKEGEVLYGRNGEIISGKILSITSPNNGGLISFQTTDSDQVVKVPAAEIVGVKLNSKPVKDPRSEVWVTRFGLAPFGMFRAHAYRFDGQLFTVNHALLGELSIPRHTVSILKFEEPKKKGNK